MAKIIKQTIQDAKGKAVAMVLPIEEYEALVASIEDKDDIIAYLQFEISKLKGEPFEPIELKWESVDNQPKTRYKELELEQTT
jgi:hypothetical protein